MDTNLRLRIVLEKPPAGVDFGLQEGKGHDYKTVQKQRSKGKDLTFSCTVAVRHKDGFQNFLGPLTQGPPTGRFIYIDIGQFAGQKACQWSRRLKIPLSGITWQMIEKGSLLEARIRDTGKDGGPSCGTVKPCEGWKLVTSS
jgi:hypothetical protein